MTVSEGVGVEGAAVGEMTGVVVGLDSVTVTSGTVASGESESDGLGVGLSESSSGVFPEVEDSLFAI